METACANFKEINEKERAWFRQDFSVMGELLNRIRLSFIKGAPVSLSDLNLNGIFDYSPKLSFTYITLFQDGLPPIRYGSRRQTLEETLNRDISKLKENKNFQHFETNNPDKCRIMIEFLTDRTRVFLDDICTHSFAPSRFEIGINGIELRKDDISTYYMPTDAITHSHMNFKSALELAIKRTPIGKMTNKISERIKIFKEANYEIYLTKSRAFISYKNDVLPLYRGNILYDDFNYNTVIEQFTKSCDWLVQNMFDDGRFLYYYDCTTDTRKDHEHPSRPEDDLYYNDLRHCGGIITLVRAFSQTKDLKYIMSAKKAIDWIISITNEHSVDWKPAYYVFYNNKAKLGGTGMGLISLMQYRITSNDTSYDKYIEGYARHLLSRIHKSGEFLGYYIHPSYNKGKPLVKMNEQERKETFSFYYPGEALLGLALFANHYDKNNRLVDDVRRKAKAALDWIVEERPKIYKELFTPLPSDAWLMQAIEEWCNDEKFIKNEYLKFVFDDARTMMQKMYTADDSPYIDFEGGYYYEYGDHFYPDGARSEGLIAAYWLARKLGKSLLAEELLVACKKAAKCQFQLFNSEKINYAHKNPEKSLNSIRFKATRQWVRVDSIQHVACFFIRLFWAENPLKS